MKACHGQQKIHIAPGEKYVFFPSQEPEEGVAPRPEVYLWFQKAGQVALSSNFLSCEFSVSKELAQGSVKLLVLVSLHCTTRPSVFVALYTDGKGQNNDVMSSSLPFLRLLPSLHFTIACASCCFSCCCSC